MKLLNRTNNIKQFLWQVSEALQCSMLELMAGEGRDQLVFSLDDLSVDLTRQPVTPASLSALLQLADSAGLRQNIDDMMAGRSILPKTGRLFIASCAALNTAKQRPLPRCALLWISSAARAR